MKVRNDAEAIHVRREELIEFVSVYVTMPGSDDVDALAAHAEAGLVEQVEDSVEVNPADSDHGPPVVQVAERFRKCRQTRHRNPRAHS